MKLNLLPQTVSRGARTRSSWVLFVLLILIGAGAMAAMIIISTDQDRKAKQEVADARPAADEAYAYSTQADTIMQRATGEARNIGLAQVMLKHNTVYPDAYEDLFKYNPPFFRLISIVATPIDDKMSSITMQGTLTTYQQYADLMIALMRNPKVVSVSRSGYTWSQDEVPPLSADDQVGKPRKQGAPAIPDDPLQRLTYFETTATPPGGYTGAGNFGSGPTSTKTAKPGDSLITVTMVAMYPLQTPNPRATLQESAGTGGGAAAPGGPAATTAVAPASVPGPRGGGAAAAGGAGKGKDESD